MKAFAIAALALAGCAPTRAELLQREKDEAAARQRALDARPKDAQLRIVHAIEGCTAIRYALDGRLIFEKVSPTPIDTVSGAKTPGAPTARPPHSGTGTAKSQPFDFAVLGGAAIVVSLASASAYLSLKRRRR